MTGDAYYLLREDRRDNILVSKWEPMGTVPTQVYTISLTKQSKLSCNCMSGRYRNSCRHLDMARQWIRDGYPENKEYYPCEL